MDSYPTGGIDVVCCECCVLSGKGLSDELITQPEESYRVWCVVLCELEISWMWRPWPTGGLLCQKKIQVAQSWLAWIINGRTMYLDINIMNKTLLCQIRFITFYFLINETAKQTKIFLRKQSAILNENVAAILLITHMIKLYDFTNLLITVTRLPDSDVEDLETPPRYRPNSLEALCKATRFTEAELKRIYRGFKAECPTGVVREDTFKSIYSQFFPQGGKYRLSDSKQLHKSRI